MEKFKKKSKKLSFILRHDPGSIGIDMDQNGWVFTSDLIRLMPITKEELVGIVDTDNKGRYSFSTHNKKIRANQGHSIKVDVQLEEVIPPEELYHGTAEKYVQQIMKDGLKPMARLHVHLSKDIETATNVGSRHGKVQVLTVLSNEMFKDGHKFYISKNGVYLVDGVPSEYLEE